MKVVPYAIMLGGKHPGALLELHDVRFTLATSQADAFKQMSTEWFGDAKSAHVDAWLELSVVDGYRYNERKVAGPQKTLYFVNVGSYQKNEFNEEHHYLFLIGDSLKEVKARALKTMKSKGLLVHIDNAEDIQTIIPIEKIGNQKLHWKPDPEAKAPLAQNGYWPLQKFRE